MYSAMSCNNYSYVNAKGKRVCFNYEFTKRVKTKVTNFLKNNHEESKIILFLDQLDLKLVGYEASRRYKHYDIINK